MAVAASTELECVNIMLAAIGEAPINKLTGLLPVDARTAQSTLLEVNKSVQSEGWSFNMEFNVVLTKDSVTNEITIANNVLKVDTNVYDHPTTDVIQRGLKLYDRKNNTFQTQSSCEHLILRYKSRTVAHVSGAAGHDCVHSHKSTCPKPTA